jgi:hypothetical protein
VLPQLWFRNRWSWKPGMAKPKLVVQQGVVNVEHEELGSYRFYCDGKPTLLFCDNETNVRRLHGRDDAPGFFKDAFHEFVIAGNLAAVNPAQTGTKVGALYELTVPAGGAVTVRARLTRTNGAKSGKAFADFDNIFAQRRREADEYYAGLQHDLTDADARLVQRQALAGMIWSKQFFHCDIQEWLDGDPAQPPPPPERKRGRNQNWRHLNNAEVISMPDKWEYPWFAAWDLAFHCVPLAIVDAEFAKDQLVLLTREWYMHPNGQLPA